MNNIESTEQVIFRYDILPRMKWQIVASDADLNTTAYKNQSII